MNYDNWKLSNPIDDGFGYNMVSSCCGAEIIEGDISNCCGAKFIAETDICSECKEHADVSEMVCSECDEIEDYEYEAIQRENYLEDMRNE
jgi:predicted amidophosphoribosyltransferase